MKPVRNWRQFLPVGLIALIGLFLSVMAYLVVADWERQGETAEFERAARDRISALTIEIESNIEIIHSLKSFLLTKKPVGRVEFRKFSAHFIARHQSIQALEWIPRVPTKERAAYEAAARREGLPQFEFTERKLQGEMVSAAPRDEYFPVYYVEPLAENQTAVGFDLGSEPTRLEALRKARDTGKAVASGRITLVQELERQFGFLIFLPVYRDEITDSNIGIRRQTLRGFALGVFRLQDIVEQSFAGLKQETSQSEIYLFDRSAPPESQLLYARQSGISSLEQLRETRSHSAAINVGGRAWLIVVAQSEKSFLSEEVWEPIAVLIVGLLFSVLMGAYVQNILGQRRRIAQTVIERTAELSTVNESLRDSEARNVAVLISAADGIITIDEQGRVESFNPAAERTFGYAEEEMLGRNISMLMPSPYTEEHDRYLSSYLHTGEKKIIGIGRQVTGLRKNGQQFPMDLSVNEMYLADKRLFTGVVRDLTERIEAERALKKSEGALTQLREKQILSELQASWNARIDAYRDFLHTVGNLITPARIKVSSLANDNPTHDYLEQLHARAQLFMEKLAARELESYLCGEGKRDLPQFIRGLEILEEYCGQYKSDMQSIETALTRVIETTTAQSRLQKTIAVTTEVDLVAAIEGVLRLLEDNWNQKGIDRNFSATDEEGNPLREIAVRVDTVRLFNMIHNILKNAGEAFTGSTRKKRRIDINLQYRHDSISLEVIDNGHGLNEEALARIGQMGFTTKQNSAPGEGGSGMGIHNCQIFMAGIGGRFDIASAGRGKGAKATAIFPAQVKA